jgi:hypothetical protein
MKTDDIKRGLASVGIGWIEPQDRRNRAGRFMLDRGVKMGVAVDPADVQTMLVDFCEVYVCELEKQAKEWKKLAEDAMTMRPPPSLIVHTPAMGQCEAFGHKLYPHPLTNFCENWQIVDKEVSSG